MNYAKKLIFVISLALFTGHLSAQTLLLDESSVVIAGSSSLHDWESKVEQITASAQIKEEDNKASFEALKLQFITKSIESGKSRMNSLTYEALKEKDHKTIDFDLQTVEYTANKAIAKGKLSLAGVTKEITVEGNVSTSGDKVTIESIVAIDMTEYNIEPPTAMLGTIKVGKDVSVDLKLVFKL